MKWNTFSLVGAITLTMSLGVWADDSGSNTENLNDAFDGEAGIDSTREVKTSIFPLIKHQRNEEESKLKLIHVPGAALVKSSETEETSKVSLVDVPFFKLVKSEHHEDGRFDNQFLKLPLVGSVFRHKRTNDKEKVRFLIFSHTKNVSDEKAPVRSTPGDINNRSRGKG